MEIGISTASFFTKARTEEALLEIQKLGFKVCEVFLGTFSEYEESFIGQLLEVKGDLRINSVHTLNQQFEPELFNPMKRTRDDCENILRKVCKGAGRLGARYYTFHGPAKFKKVKYVLDYPAIGRRVEELCGFVSAESGGVTQLTYENVHWTYYNEPQFITEIAPYTEVCTCLDIKQAMQSGIDCYRYIDKMGNRLKNVHLCDYKDNGRPALPGEGIFDFTKLFYTLIKTGYEGDCIIEVYPEDYDGYSCLTKSRDFLLECIYKAREQGDTIYG